MHGCQSSPHWLQRGHPRDSAGTAEPYTRAGSRAAQRSPTQGRELEHVPQLAAPAGHGQCGGHEVVQSTERRRASGQWRCGGRRRPGCSGQRRPKGSVAGRSPRAAAAAQPPTPPRLPPQPLVGEDWRGLAPLGAQNATKLGFCTQNAFIVDGIIGATFPLPNSLCRNPFSPPIANRPPSAFPSFPAFPQRLAAHYGGLARGARGRWRRARSRHP